MPTNFRTYEAQSRLLAAVVATTGARLDFRAIAAHIGSDATPSSVDHRLRPIKQLAKLQAQCVREGKDPSDLPIEKTEIQKLFGESTPAGLEFHFREVKATGKAQKAAVEKGEDPTKVPLGGQAKRAGSAPSTPASRKRAAPIKPSASKSTVRRSTKKLKAEQIEDLDSADEDYERLDVDTPSKKRTITQRRPNPAYMVNNTSAESSSECETPAPITGAGPAATQTSLFGNGTVNSSSFGDCSSTPTAHSSATVAREDDDDLLVVDGSQFSAKKSQLSQTFAPEPQPHVVNHDPFEDATLYAGDEYLDLTNSHGFDLLDGEV
ncbi:hypothetical protein BX600DRAFT_512171 [Xylariales sp. PMI_506]|nr:hypothetical protein BX600DRAFT_512171 [Xylariales sp. PMI_506]